MPPPTRWSLSVLVGAVLVTPHLRAVGLQPASQPTRSDRQVGQPGQPSESLRRLRPPDACDGVLALERRFIEDMRTKNLDDVVSLYAPGAVFIQPDSTQVIGENALRKLYRTVFATYDSDLSLEDSDIRSISAGGSLCVHSGRYTETLRTRKDSTVAHIRGVFSFTYKRMKDGHWRVTRMRWTSDT